MRYLGSKQSTLPVLRSELLRRVPSGTLCDPFGGVATVGSAFKAAGFEVHASDLLTFAVDFQRTRLELTRMPPITSALIELTGCRSTRSLERFLNTVPAQRSWIYREYATKRRYFTPRNASRIDGVRSTIGRWKSRGLLSPSMASLLNASLIDSMDRVANTAGTYYAHLKNWNRKALAPFRFRLLDPLPGPPGSTEVNDAINTVARRHYNIVYLDPPYNARNYANYYHLPETISTGREPEPHGASGVSHSPIQPAASAFISPRQAQRAFSELIEAARFDLLVIHYSDDGLVKRHEIERMARSRGRLSTFEIDALGYGLKQARSSRHRIYLVES